MGYKPQPQDRSMAKGNRPTHRLLWQRPQPQLGLLAHVAPPQPRVELKRPRARFRVLRAHEQHQLLGGAGLRGWGGTFAWYSV
jgi:hypothetical protein